MGFTVVTKEVLTKELKPGQLIYREILNYFEVVLSVTPTSDHRFNVVLLSKEQKLRVCRNQTDNGYWTVACWVTLC